MQDSSLTIASSYFPSWKINALALPVSLFILFFFFGVSIHYFILALITVVLVYRVNLFLVTSNREKAWSKSLVIITIFFLIIEFLLIKHLPQQKIINVGRISSFFNAIGFSYLLFRLISSILDTYWSKTFNLNIADFFHYNFFFPTFLSGPIERAKDFNEQINKSFTDKLSDRLTCGLPRIVKGIAKAYFLGPYVLPYTLLGDQTTSWIVASIAYTLYEFLDFSGYCDIVIGISRLFGIKLTENFVQPYLATSPKDLWMRWHRSLSLFFRDYVFFPFLKVAMKNFNICNSLRIKQLIFSSFGFFIVFVLCGLWHGRTLGGILFGLWFFLALSFNTAYDIYLAKTLKEVQDSRKALKTGFDLLGRLAAMITLIMGNALFFIEKWKNFNFLY